MDKDQIKIVRDWFENEDEARSYYTYYNGNGEYSVNGSDVDEFSDFIEKEFPDLIGIECMVGKGGIWFWDSSLEKAQFI